MSRLSPQILSLLEKDALQFEALPAGMASMSVERFESNFGLLASGELPGRGGSVHYYRHHGSPHLVMRIEVTPDGLQARMDDFAHFEQRLEYLLSCLDPACGGADQGTRSRLVYSSASK